VVEGRWLVDPAVSFVDRELKLAYMQLSNSLPRELFEAYHDERPPDPGYEQRVAFRLS
jgi:fructosamine-3-kinase